ncbi:hypothetical protein [Spirosoma sp. KUDC1026]|uniref:hypothetical protein n=1 Tax=Spirosoma sp. KUDC1026 TaxID=2745947 RepID=UPI00159B8ADA|nr:hypothetical protein [Spirosoma sp. KUDC1026]QKZ14197.1 hypothetical protein HU175_16810 [Spirosoma sp. KUDC1026]
MIKQPKERIDDFIQQLFGLYCDPRQERFTKDNIENITSRIWDASSEQLKYKIGAKFGIYRKNGESDRRDLAQKFLELVAGLDYKDEDSLTAELIEKLQELRTSHFGWYNFYNEYPHAKAISDSLPRQGIPKAIRRLFVKVICQCWIGNGLGYREGIDERATNHYNEFITLFDVNAVKEFIDLFNDPEFVTDFDKQKPEERTRVLANHFKTVTSDIYVNDALDLIVRFPKKSIKNIASDSRFKEVSKRIKI